MKRLFLSVLLIIFLFNANCEEIHKKKQRRELFYQYLIMAAGGLITGYFATKYVQNSREMSKILTWQNDRDWEDRFFNLHQNKGITLQYISLIIDNFASTILNECIKNFKRQKEQQENTEEFQQKNLQVQELTQLITENYEEFENGQNQELNQKFEELQELHKQTDVTQLRFEKQSQYCLNFYHFQVKYSFLSKYMFDLRYVMTYYKLLNNNRNFEEFLTEEQQELSAEEKNNLLVEEERIFREFLDVMSDLINFDKEWQKLNQQFATTYYTIHNIFTQQEKIINLFIMKRFLFQKNLIFCLTSQQKSIRDYDLIKKAQKEDLPRKIISDQSLLKEIESDSYEKALINVYQKELKIFLYGLPQDPKFQQLSLLINFNDIQYKKLDNILFTINLERFLRNEEKLDFKKQKFELPLIQVYQTFEDSFYIWGYQQVQDFLLKEQLLDMSVFRKESPWTQQGLEIVENQIIQPLEIICMYPLVIQKASVSKEF